MASKEVENLVKLLEKYKTIYSRDEVIKAVMAEGFSRKVARDVIDELYEKETKKKERREAETKAESKAEAKGKQMAEPNKANTKTTGSPLAPTNPPASEEHYSEVDKLLNQLKASIPTPPPEENVGEELNRLQEENVKLAKEEEKKAIELEETVENPQNHKDKDVAEIPRRLRRFYRQDEPVQQEQESGSRHYRDRLKELQGKNEPIQEEESHKELHDNIVDVIYNQVKEKTDLNKPKDEIEKITKDEVDRFRSRHNREPNMRGEMNQIVDNIFTQLTRDEELKKLQGQKEEEKKVEEKSPEKNKENASPFDLNLDLPNFNLDSKVSDSDLGDLDLNLNFDLNAPSEQKKKEEKR